jgi:hypothetical protein
MGLAILGTILVTGMRHQVTSSLIAQGLPAGRASAAASQLSQTRSGGGSVGAIPHFIRLDFAHATQTVLYIMAAIMAAAAIVALFGLRAGVQKEKTAAGTDAEGAPADVASAETRVPGAEGSAPPQPQA